MCWRRSLQAGFPVAAGSPQIPSRSSTAWKASPSSTPKRLERRDGFARRPGEDGADRARAAEQRAGLARLHREAALDVDDRDRLERHVERLPGDHRRGRVGDRGGRALAVEGAPVGPRQPDHERRVEHDLLREGEQGVAHDDGAADAEQRPDRRPVPALGVLVDDIVVDQREVVDELDRDTAGDPDDPLRRRPPRPRARRGPGARPCRRRRRRGGPRASAQPRWYSAIGRSSGESRSTAARSAGATRLARPARAPPGRSVSGSRHHLLGQFAYSSGGTDGAERTGRRDDRRCAPHLPSWQANPCRSTSRPGRAR